MPERISAMTSHRFAALIFSFFVFGTVALAQKNELGLSVGASFTSDEHATNFISIPCPPNNPTCNVVTSVKKTSTAVAIDGSFARRIAAWQRGSLYAEIPVLGIPSRGTQDLLNNGNSISLSTSSFFITPSAKFKFDLSAISPFASVGGGFAHFAENGLNLSHRNTGTFHLGGGVDFRSPVRHLKFRAETRYFYSGTSLHASDFAQISPTHQHTVFLGGGPVFAF
jgi:hypothetical protein